MTDVVEIRTAHTSELDVATLRLARTLLDAVFTDDMTDEDWEHSLGGVHSLAWEGDELIGHASVVQRRLLHHGRALRTGYVEGVGIRADRRGRGHGDALMAPLENVIRHAYDLGALGAAANVGGFYAHRGWQAWQGRLSTLTTTGIQHTPDEEGFVYLYPCGSELDFTGELTCDWRNGDVW